MYTTVCNHGNYLCQENQILSLIFFLLSFCYCGLLVLSDLRLQFDEKCCVVTS